MSEQASIAFIGAGNMANCLIAGLIQSGYPAANIYAADPNQDNLAKLSEQWQINTDTDNHKVITKVDCVVLAIKPQIFYQIATSLSESIKARKPLLISIMAGVSCQRLTEFFGSDAPMVRAMPNLPAAVAAGATGLYANPQVTETNKQLVDAVFNGVGICAWVNDEKLIDVITALSGSGPAYFFYVLESLQAAAIELGLADDIAKTFATQTALGAAKLSAARAHEVDTLRAEVTSKGGTTAAALETLEQGGLKDLFKRAVTAAAERAQELSKIS